MKRICCLFLSIVCILQLTQTAFAAENNMLSISYNSSYSFMDSEEKENTLVITVLESGDVVVDNYIEGVFANSSRSTVTDGNTVLVTTTYADGERSTQQFVISDQNTSELAMKSSEEELSASTVYTYAGKVDFLGHYEGYAPGTYHTHTLNFYESFRYVTDEYKDINIGAGTAVSAAVGVVVCVLMAIVFPTTLATGFAEQLIIAAVCSVGGTIVGGVVQSFVSKRYYVRSWKYYIKASDPDSGKSKIYNGEEYRVYLEGGGYSSEVYYTGKRNWWTINVLTLIWPDFWSCGYPGVSSVTRA